MQTAFIIQGTLENPKHITLDEPVDFQGHVEVILRPVPEKTSRKKMSIFNFIASLPPGDRTDEDIAKQINEERGSWDDK